MFKLSGDAAGSAFVFVAPTLGVTDQALVASQSIRMTEKASVVRRLFSLAASPSISFGAIVFTIFRGFDPAVVLFNERRAIRLREPDSTPSSTNSFSKNGSSAAACRLTIRLPEHPDGDG
jgi:hypothetical protein